MSTPPTASIDPARIAHLQQQQALFEQAKPDLLPYLGEFIAFEDNQVLDHDSDEQNLAERVYSTYGYRDLLIKQVLHQEPQLFVRGFVPNSHL
jgi:hypothetical protein